MATYWHQHPRGFANECDLVRADTVERAAELDAAGYQRLTRVRLSKHVRMVNGENDAWGSNRAYGRIVLRDVLYSPEYSAAWREVYG